MHGGDNTEYRTDNTEQASGLFDAYEDLSWIEDKERKKREHEELQRRARALYKKGNRKWRG